MKEKKKGEAPTSSDQIPQQANSPSRLISKYGKSAVEEESMFNKTKKDPPERTIFSILRA
jgi:hypothetical protein